MEIFPHQEGRNWSDYLLTLITDLIQMKEYDRALLIAEQGLEIFPHYPDLLYVTSVIYQNLDMADKSIQLLEKALNIYPFNLEIRSLLGRTLMFQGYYHSALSVMSHFTIISHELAGVNKLFIAYCKAYSGNAQSVIESLDWCEEDFSHVDDNAWYLAVIRALKVIALIQNQEVDAALRLVSEIEAEFDDTLFVAYAKGIAAWKNSDLISAETFLRLACSSNPCDMRAKKDLAALLSVLGRHEEAADIQREMKGFFGPWNRNENPLYRAEELIRSENFDEAERYLSWACENYPDRHDLILSMISLCSFTGHYDLVISYADSLKNSEFEWKSLYLKASAYYTAGDARSAIRCLISTIVRDRTYSLIAVLYMKRIGFFQDPIMADPDGMALMVFCTDEFDSAVPLFENLVDTYPDILEYRAFLTYCYILLERNADAVLCAEPLSVSDDPDMCMIRALAFRIAGCLEDAKRVTEEIRKRYPKYVPALNMYIRILTDHDMYRSAFFELSSHPDVLFTDASLLEVYIRCLLRAGDFHDAATASLRLMVTFPDRPMNYSLLAQAFMDDGNIDAGLYAIREGFRLDGFHPESIRLYVKLLLQSSQPQEAFIILSELGGFLPDSPEIRYLMNAARILSGEGSSDESVEECSARIFQTENGIIRGYIGENRIAVRLLIEAIKQNPADYSLRVALAQVLFELGQDSEGFHQLSLAIENGEEDNSALSLMDVALDALRLNTSIDEFEKISHGDVKRLAELVYGQAVRLNQFGVRNHAIATFRYVSGLVSPSPVVQSIRADACHILGDLEEDPEWYERGLALYNELLSEDPDNPVYLAKIGLLLDDLCRYEEAEDVLVRALEINPDLGVANSALCWCLGATGRYQEALLYGNKAIIQIPDDWGAWNNRGVVKLALQDYEGAASDFRQAIRCSPGELIPRNNLCEALLSLDDADVHDAYVDILVRFGYKAISHDEGEKTKRAPDLNRYHGTITGYMEGYW